VTATKSGESDLENPARPSRNRMTARVTYERRNFAASYNFRVREALGNLRTPRRFRTLVEQTVQVNEASLPLFLRSSTGPNRAFEPQSLESLGRVPDPVRIAEGPTHVFGFSILDCGLKQREPHCRKRLHGERGSSSIAFMSALMV
jgi:hypothetical protein